MVQQNEFLCIKFPSIISNSLLNLNLSQIALKNESKIICKLSQVHLVQNQKLRVSNGHLICLYHLEICKLFMSN